ncbi:MAG: lysylphosphatidylglycerol synthase transmembrane domain-containing protein [Acidobacteria bacterium]|nr:lysylphosphatidylglycerol synthase transmembrane domain-containing protein [Acidobacteriota bacterium]
MRRPAVGGIVRIAVAVALTAFMFWKSHPSDVMAALARTELGPVLMAVLLVLVDRALMAYRWLVLLRPIAGPASPRFPTVMRIFFVSTFVGSFLPATVGADAARAYALAREGVATSAAVASVVMDRILGVLGILIMAAVGLVFARQLADNPVVLAGLALTTAVCAATAVVVFSARAEMLVQRLVGFLPWARVRDLVARLVGAMQMYATRHGDLLNVTLGSIGVQVLRTVQAYYLGLGLGIEQPLTTYVAFIPVILLVMLLPVTVNGFGTSQLAFVWAFGQAGVPAALAFPLSVLFVALGVVGNLPGGLLYATGGMRARRRDRERS